LWNFVLSKFVRFSQKVIYLKRSMDILKICVYNTIHTAVVRAAVIIQAPDRGAGCILGWDDELTIM
ncbi:hypothetical protein EAI30_18305, partial [Romboutsia ilealis]|nr:hypothetical protein [Romboutsia ilealis]